MSAAPYFLPAVVVALLVIAWDAWRAHRARSEKPAPPPTAWPITEHTRWPDGTVTTRTVDHWPGEPTEQDGAK